MTNTISDEDWAALRERAIRAHPTQQQLGHPDQVRASRQGAEQLRAAREGRQ